MLKQRSRNDLRHNCHVSGHAGGLDDGERPGRPADRPRDLSLDAEERPTHPLAVGEAGLGGDLFDGQAALSSVSDWEWGGWL